MLWDKAGSLLWDLGLGENTELPLSPLERRELIWNLPERDTRDFSTVK